MRGRHTVARLHQRGLGLLADDIIAQLHTLVADEHRRSGDELPDLVLTLAAEGAVEGVFRIPAAQLRHITIPFGRTYRHAPPTALSYTGSIHCRNLPSGEKRKVITTSSFRHNRTY